MNKYSIGKIVNLTFILAEGFSESSGILLFYSNFVEIQNLKIISEKIFFNK